MLPDAVRAIVLADGAVPARATLDAAWPGWDEGVSMVVAADGGARHATELGLRVDHWVGDGDSIGPAHLEALAAAGASVTRAPTDKDESDSELALMTALDAGAEEVIVLGALGGLRVDHALANLGLLSHPGLEGRRAVLYDERGARVSLLAAPRPDGADGDASRTLLERVLEGRVGDLVSLVPVGETAVGVTTSGLRYPLVRERLVAGRTRGVSNVKIQPVSTVSLEGGRLLVIETPANLRP